MGPNELIPPLNLFTKGDSLYIFSRPTWTLYSSKISSLTKVKLNKKFMISTDASNIYPLPDGTFLSSGAFKNKRFNVLDSNGMFLYSFGDFPSFWSEESNLPTEVKRMFHQVCGYSISSSNKIALTTSHVLNIYNYSNKKVSLEKEILLAPYEYNYVNKGISSKASLKENYQYGATDLIASDKYIYMLFNSGNKNQKKKIQEIWKFDWAGNLLYKLPVGGIKIIDN